MAFPTQFPVAASVTEPSVSAAQPSVNNSSNPNNTSERASSAAQKVLSGSPLVSDDKAFERGQQSDEAVVSFDSLMRLAQANNPQPAFTLKVLPKGVVSLTQENLRTHERPIESEPRSFSLKFIPNSNATNNPIPGDDSDV